VDNHYLANVREASIHEVPTCNYNGLPWGLFLTDSALYRLSVDMVGYAPGLCPRGQPLVNDAKTFWDRMAGLQGGTFRRDVDAIFSTALTINAQVGGRVLAPWLIQVSPVAGYVLTHAQDVYLDFDTAMYSAFLSLDPSAFFTDVDGVLALYPNFLPFWENNSRIHLAVYPRKVGNGYLFVDGSKIHSQGGIKCALVE